MLKFGRPAISSLRRSRPVVRCWRLAFPFIMSLPRPKREQGAFEEGMEICSRFRKKLRSYASSRLTLVRSPALAFAALGKTSPLREPKKPRIARLSLRTAAPRSFWSSKRPAHASTAFCGWLRLAVATTQCHTANNPLPRSNSPEKARAA